MTFNLKDLCWYGTNSERLAITLPDERFPNTEKFIEVDTGLIFVSYNNEWYEL